MKKYIIFILLIAVSGFWFYQINFFDKEKINLPEAKQYKDFTQEKVSDKKQESDIVTSTEEDEQVVEIVEEDKEEVYIVTSTEEDEQVVEIVEEDVPDEIIINDSINLDVPFTSQAPMANWEQPWQDACEEASVLMVDYYYQNKKMTAKTTTNQTLFDMVAWQEENWQVNENLPLAQLALYIKATLNYETEIVNDLTIEKMKYYLDRGLPIIVPADGKKLDNPFFSNGGPEYHMLVVKGYVDSDKKFITNDPGTSRGEDFIYSYDNLMDSIADWDKKRSSATGPKRVLILYRN